MPRNSRPGVLHPNPSAHRGVWTVYGKVNNDSAPTILAGTGFSVGGYSSSAITITFTNKAAKLVNFTVTPVGDFEARVTTDYSASAGTIVVTTYTANSTAADADFYFSATFSDATVSP